MNDKKIPKTIPGIIKVIKESNDINTIIAMENYACCYYAGPLILIGAISNYYISYNIMNYPLGDVIGNSIFLLIISIFFIILPYLKLEIKYLTHVVSILYSIILLYLSFRFYPIIGSFIWTIAFVEIIIASARITKVMLNYVTITTFLVSIYVSILISKKSHELTPVYYILQAVIFLLMFLVIPAIYIINKSHYERINKLYFSELHQRKELEKMYKKISDQYNILDKKNKQLELNENKLYKLAHFDTLTNLPNRKSILDKIDSLIKISKDISISFYVIFIDIDSFKRINDSMGHHIGDRFISAASNRFKESINKHDLIGRIGGDEFALIIQRNLNDNEVYEYVEEIRSKFLNPFIIEDNNISVSASFGIAAFPRDGIEQVELMKNADTAMYKAKDLGKNNIQFFNYSMKKELLDKISIESKLNSALLNEEFFLVFQPIYNLKTGNIRGFEALVRWESPELGFVSPDKFIPAAEELGLIIPLGEWIMRTACKTFKKLQENYNLDSVISINLSVKQLESSNIIETIKHILAEIDLDAKFVEIEVTESIFINSIHNTKLILQKLRDMNISISLDDFGTGYSSLSYLRQLPIDILKIDRSFINDILKGEKNIEIIGSIINLSHNLDIEVVAEGIEEEIQLRHLRNLKCDYVQGFLMSKPLREKDLENYLISYI